MYALLILPILVSGFLCLTIQQEEYWRLHRYDGQYLYLKAAQKGLKHFFFAIVISLLMRDFTFNANNHLPNLICSLSPPSAPSAPSAFIDTPLLKIELNDCVIHSMFDPAIATILSGHISDISPVRNKAQIEDSKTKNLEYAWLICISILSILSALLLSKLKNYYGIFVNFISSKVNKDYSNKNIYQLYLMHKIFKDSPMDNIFFESLIKKKPVLISLKSRKTYVGIVIATGEPNESNGLNQEIVVLPIMSGYRDKDTLSVIFTNDYASFTTESTSTVLDVASIEVASWFDFECYEKVNKNIGDAEKKEQKSKKKFTFGLFKRQE